MALIGRLVTLWWFGLALGILHACIHVLENSFHLQMGYTHILSSQSESPSVIKAFYCK